MFHLVVAASLQYVVESYQVALNVGIGIRNRVANTCLRSKIHHHCNIVLSENALHCLLIGNGVFYKRPVAPKSLNLLQTLILDIDIIIISYAVYSYDADISDILEKSFNQVTANKACSSCYQDSFVV